jgi:archaellum component FlaC
MNMTETDQILDYLKRIDASVNGLDEKIGSTTGKPPLSDRVDTIGDKVDALSDRVDQIDAKIGDTTGKPPLSDRVDTIGDKVDALDGRVSEVQFGLATLAASTMAQFAKVDARFDKVDGQFAKVDAQFAKVDARFNRVDHKIDGLRDELVDHMERIHDELAGRIVDLETPPRGGTGGSVAAS